MTVILGPKLTLAQVQRQLEAAEGRLRKLAPGMIASQHLQGVAPILADGPKRRAAIELLAVTLEKELSAGKLMMQSLGLDPYATAGELSARLGDLIAAVRSHNSGVLAASGLPELLRVTEPLRPVDAAVVAEKVERAGIRRADFQAAVEQLYGDLLAHGHFVAAESLGAVFAPTEGRGAATFDLSLYPAQSKLEQALKAADSILELIRTGPREALELAFERAEALMKAAKIETNRFAEAAQLRLAQDLAAGNDIAPVLLAYAGPIDLQRLKVLAQEPASKLLQDTLIAISGTTDLKTLQELVETAEHLVATHSLWNESLLKAQLRASMLNAVEKGGLDHPTSRYLATKLGDDDLELVARAAGRHCVKLAAAGLRLESVAETQYWLQEVETHRAYFPAQAHRAALEAAAYFSLHGPAARADVAEAILAAHPELDRASLTANPPPAMVAGHDIRPRIRDHAPSPKEQSLANLIVDFALDPTARWTSSEDFKARVIAVVDRIGMIEHRAKWRARGEPKLADQLQSLQPISLPFLARVQDIVLSATP